MNCSPTFEQVKQLAIHGNKIPIFRQLELDLLSPIAAYLKLQNPKQPSFLFESVLGGEKIGRYSFIGTEPAEVLKKFNGDPLKLIEAKLAQIKSVKVDGLPDFTGGAVGFVSFDCIEYFEPTTKCELNDPLGIPDAVFLMCDTIIIFDHLFSVIKICSNINVQSKDDELTLRQSYDRAVNEISRIEQILCSDEISTVEQKECFLSETVSNVGENGYKQFVDKIKTFIKSGDVIQVVPSQRLKKKTNLHPFNAYRKLRTVNPSPYMFYLDLCDFQLVGASPEMLVKVQDRRVEMHPIAGTRRRGATVEEDNLLAQDLIMDLKERSEHVMLVDLGRNDVNRVCDPLTVKVDSLMHIERYAHVMHIVSNVSGILREEETPINAFRSIFPAGFEISLGTVSGAPKIRAIQIIRELEKEKRGVYAGAVGHFDYSGGLDTCIAIRTMLFKDGHVYLQAGGGIVHDSNPEDELQETVNKLRSNVVAIEKAEKRYHETK